ncbi:MupA/Atu3671 family FMN-dependent luciferase-like monooxygenase [Nocardia sp. bgisy118]|uniref:MupA/Atu3671 family FMN-dependent luciferase-like monooxygenase n=1 Tax=Nocardia sp. bgisy118 TaxID=3413786 RepID=UPI003F4A52D8
MTVEETVSALSAVGVRLSLRNGRVQCSGPSDVLTPDVLEHVRSREAEIVDLLTRRDDPSRPHPLTAGQQSLYLHQRLAPSSAAYNLAFAANMAVEIDIRLLNEALCAVVSRHSILRTTYIWDEVELLQQAGPAPASLLEVIDVAETELDHALVEYLDSPFDLDRDLPIRAAVLRARSGQGPAEAACVTTQGSRSGAIGHSSESGETVVAMVVHHIAADLSSVDIIVREWLAEYHNRAGQSPRRHGSVSAGPDGFHTRVWAEQDWLAGTQATRNLAFWQEELGGRAQALDLPVDRVRPAAPGFRGGLLPVALDPRLSADLGRVARAADVSANMLFLSAFQVLLGMLGGTERPVVGMPAVGPRTERTYGTVGFFADPVPIRADLSGDPTFGTVLERTRSAVLRALDHPYPFPLLVQRLGAVRDRNRSPLFQVMYVWQQTPESEQAAGDFTLLPCSGQRGAPYDLVLSVGESDTGYSCTWSYDVDLFERPTVERFARSFEAVLRAVADAPATRISVLPTLSEPDREAVLRDCTGPVKALPETDWLAQFAAQADRTPNAIALVCDGEELSYQELATRARRLAGLLIERGVGPDVRIGLCLERSIELVVTMLAVCWAGGAYVPLDPRYPADRLSYTVTDASVLFTICDAVGLQVFGRSSDAVVPLSALEGDPAVVPDQPAAAPESLSYVIYTSGSTGRPKGVMVTRRNVVNLFVGLDASVGTDTAGAQSVWLAVTSVCFDISVVELLWTLSRGFRVIVETAAWTAGARPGAPAPGRLDFSLFYFAADSGRRSGRDQYRLLLDGARFADSHDFSAVWVPERHFHAFGGAYPNPSVLASTVAAVTERTGIRAGSVVLPLQDPLRVVEEWSVVDNLSDGRVGLSFASGWQPNDFVLAPDAYAGRREDMWGGIDTVRALWRGERITRRNGAGADIEVGTYPRPVQAELPVWATAAGSTETFQRAGASGANLLTHLLGQNPRELASKIEVYRKARADAGYDAGVVSLMLHTFVHPDESVVRAAIAEPFRDYLRTSIDLMRGLAKGLGLDPERDREVIVEHAFTRFAGTSALFGTPQRCAELAAELAAIGVDEIACLVDFGIDDELVLDALTHLATVRDALAAAVQERVASPAEVIAAHDVSYLQCTPALAKILLLEHESGADAAPAMPRAVLVGGDAVPSELGEQLRAAGVEQVLTMYGPTETCVWSAVQPTPSDPAGRITVGGPIANTTLYVLDRYGRLQPPGVAGELHIGGAGVGRGYWNRPDQTANVFVPDPFSAVPGARMYATGDLVRHLGRGRFEFLGRIDFQFKVRGFRVEAGEIEALLLAQDSVAECVVAAPRGHSGDVSLVAFVVGAPDTAPDVAELRERLRATLPDYMVPSRIVLLDRLPLTVNGKIDRGELMERAGELDRAEVAYIPPKDEIEVALHAMWVELLDIDRIGTQENFFEIGGHSLLAATLHARITSADLGRLELVDLFTYPTIAGLARRLRAGDEGVSVPGRAADRASRQLAAAQRRKQRRKSA